MKLIYKKEDILRGALIYASGDTIASYLLDEFSFYRMLGIALIGATLYAFEIPNYFLWIDKKLEHSVSKFKNISRGLLAFAFFNPVWIARHILFINILSGRAEDISWNLLVIGFYSFTVKIPVSLGVNYLIQNVIPLKWRFASSAAFTAILAIYYAISEVLFG